MEDLLSDPQAAAANGFVTMRTGTDEVVRVPNGPVDFGAAEVRVLDSPPGPGEHSLEILASIGIIKGVASVALCFATPASVCCMPPIPSVFAAFWFTRFPMTRGHFMSP